MEPMPAQDREIAQAICLHYWTRLRHPPGVAVELRSRRLPSGGKYFEVKPRFDLLPFALQLIHFLRSL